MLYSYSLMYDDIAFNEIIQFIKLFVKDNKFIDAKYKL